MQTWLFSSLLAGINDAFATLQWGWNFDFVPKTVRGNRVVWARTDKSIHTHVYELSADFYDATPARKMTVMSRFGIDVKHLEKGLAEKIEQRNFLCFYRKTNGNA